MAEPQTLLAVDVGSAYTRVALIKSIDGEYRFVAGGRSITSDFGPPDVMASARSAMREIQARIGHRLLTDDGQMLVGRTGADAMSIVASAPPLRVAIIGLTRDIGVASALRALDATNCESVAALALDDVANLVDSLAAANPEVIVLVGGVDGGATTRVYDVADQIAVWLTMRDERARPIVIFAGNKDARPEIAARLGQVTMLRMADNVRSALELENLSALQGELQTLYLERKVKWLPGVTMLASQTNAPIVSATQAFENVVRHLARKYGISVLGADVGASTTMLITARGDVLTRHVKSNLGLGAGMENLLAQTGVARLQSWLPIEIDAHDVQTFCLNRSLRPTTLPTTCDDLRLIQSAARLALASIAQNIDDEGFDLVVATGGVFAHNADVGALALIVLDGLQPSGVFTLAVDTLGLAPAFGGIESVNALAAAQIIERESFMTLGTVIAPVSGNADGQIDLRVQINSEQTIDVQHGALELIPLASGERAHIEVKLFGEAQLAQAHRGVFKAEIEGGMLGIIIDARGRPIAEPTREQTRRWHRDMGVALETENA